MEEPEKSIELPYRRAGELYLALKAPRRSKNSSRRASRSYVSNTARVRYIIRSVPIEEIESLDDERLELDIQSVYESALFYRMEGNMRVFDILARNLANLEHEKYKRGKSE